MLHAVVGEGLEEQHQGLLSRGLGEEAAVGCRGELGAWVLGRRAQD